MKQTILLFSISILAIAVYSQQSRQLWIDVNHLYGLNEHVFLHQDIGTRWTNAEEFSSFKYVIRQEIRYNLNSSWGFRAGFGWFNEDRNNGTQNNEFRPHLGVIHSMKIGKRIRWGRLARIEFRTMAGELSSIRLRYQSKFYLQLNNPVREHRLDWFLHPEFFSTKEISEFIPLSQLRLSTGFRYFFSFKLWMEAHLMYETFKEYDEWKYIQQHLVIRPRLIYRW